MRLADLVQHYGNQTAAGDALGVSQSTISGWEERGIPHLRQLQIEVLTCGALMADAESAAELRLPDGIDFSKNCAGDSGNVQTSK